MAPDTRPRILKAIMKVLMSSRVLHMQRKTLQPVQCIVSWPSIATN